MTTTKTIAQQLKIKDFPFIINDKDGNEIYYETSDSYWYKREYDAHGNLIRYENSDGFWCKSKYDAHGNEIYYEDSIDYWEKTERNAHGNLIRYEDSNGLWVKREYDANGKEIYYETSNGTIIDKRPKQVELTLQQIADALGIKVEQLRIKE